MVLRAMSTFVLGASDPAKFKEQFDASRLTRLLSPRIDASRLTRSLSPRIRIRGDFFKEDFTPPQRPLAAAAVRAFVCAPPVGRHLQRRKVKKATRMSRLFPPPWPAVWIAARGAVLGYAVRLGAQGTLTVSPIMEMGTNG